MAPPNSHRSPSESTIEECDVTILAVERSLIGALLISGPSVEAEMPPLLPDEFFSLSHQMLWAAMQRLVKAGVRPGLINVQHELAKHDELAAVGGPVHVFLCYEEGHIPAYVPGLAKQVREAARKRALRRLGDEMRLQGLTEPEVQARLRELPAPFTSEVYDPAYNWRDAVGDWEGHASVSLGLVKLDAITGGLKRGQIVIVGGRSSHGKTSFACDRGLEIAKQGIKVEIVTLEDSQTELVKKLVANLAGIEARRVSSGQLSIAEFEDCEEAVRRLQGLPLTITACGYDETFVEAVVSRSTAEVVIVDHLQKIRVQGVREHYNYALKRIVDRYHEIARRDGKVVWINAQLGRDMDVNKRAPTLADLRDSGSIEESARQVLLLYWPSRQGQDRPLSEYEINVAKNQGGTTGKVDVEWDPRIGRFSDAIPTIRQQGD